jgi:hypothetical protein
MINIPILLDVILSDNSQLEAYISLLLRRRKIVNKIVQKAVKNCQQSRLKSRKKIVNKVV